MLFVVFCGDFVIQINKEKKKQQKKQNRKKLQGRKCVFFIL